MKSKCSEKQSGPVLFIPHGGGPLPLLGEKVIRRWSPF